MSQVNPQYRAFLDQMQDDWEQSCRIYYAKDRPEPTWSWARENTLSRMRDALSKIKLGRVLEIGCGGGIWTNMLLDLTDDVTALDTSGYILDKAREFAPGADYIQTDGWSLPDGPFDTVFTYGVLLHLPQELVYRYILESARVARRAVLGIRTVESDGIRAVKRQLEAGRVPFHLGYITVYSEAVIGAMLDDAGFVWDVGRMGGNSIFWAELT